MERHDVERVIAECLKPVFGYALKRCRNTSDAEDVTQEIMFKAYKTLLPRDDIEDAEKYIRSIAHNTVVNYYRTASRGMIEVPIDEVSEFLADPTADAFTDPTDREAASRLQSEIAYLSKLQRKIVIAYYFENKRQSVIAEELGIPLGTVKWHLFEAKRELKRGIIKMREYGELKYNPVKFDSVGICGSAGTKRTSDHFRSSLSQNICYSIRSEAKTIEEIADELGVSPVYVESEVEYLEEYDILKKQKNKYIANFIIDEVTSDYLKLQDEMYKKASSLFANDLYDELTLSGLLADDGIICRQTDGEISLTSAAEADRNFILWSLIPYIAALSGEELMDEHIKFEEVATMRKDGGFNIIHATVTPSDISLPDDYVYMKRWCGPMWNRSCGRIMWQIDSEWSDRGDGHEYKFSDEAARALSYYDAEFDGPLSKEDYVWLCEHGFVKTNGDYDGNFKSSWQIVILENHEIKEKLLAIGTRIKEKYKTEFDKIKEPYIKAALETVPEHLHRAREYELQFVFHSDGWFLLHCIKALLANGKLTVPTEGQRKSITTVIFPE
ncbi:MAG: sigma-70 family RNA polymerase sigma factor [Clostridia bacterium]|nr:sigma-70 family RNA polymerase sigma factor [Clostridia bacterium]